MVLNKTQELFLMLLRCALTRQTPPSDALLAAGEESLVEVMSLAQEQGLNGVISEVLASSGIQNSLSTSARLSVMCPAVVAEEACAKRFERASELAAMFREAGLRTLVLKGFACASYYPVPEHRVGGDFDCYLCGGYEKGNEIAAAAGCKVHFDDYKHSRFKFRSLVVENHRFCIPFRGDRRLRELERVLEELALRPSSGKVADSCIEIPDPQFNALFLLAHASHHFISEGLTMRQVADWGMFLAAEQSRVDWEAFSRVASAARLKVFADALTTLCVRWLGLELQTGCLSAESPWAERVLQDALVDRRALFNRGLKGVRYYAASLRNSLDFIWKYHKIYRQSLLWSCLCKLPSWVAGRSPSI